MNPITEKESFSKRPFHFISSHKKLFLLILLGLVLLGIAAAIILTLSNESVSTLGDSVLREYQVQKGDLTVGTTENGTISLERESISFPVNATIEQILVKAGMEVKEGDALIIFDQESVKDSSTESTAKLTEAKLSLTQALSDQKVKLQEAKNAYESSKALAGYSTMQEQLTKQEVEYTLEEAKINLQDAVDELAKYQSLMESYDTDTARLEELEEWMEEAKSLKESYEAQLFALEQKNKTLLDQVSALKSEQEKAKVNRKAAEAANEELQTEESASALSEAEAKYNAAVTAYEEYSSDADDVTEKQTALSEKVAVYTAEYENYSKAYNDFKETYTKNYKGSSSGDSSASAGIISKEDLSKKVTSLELSLKQAQLKYDKAMNESSLTLLEAGQKLLSNQAELSNAETVYQLAVEKAALDVTTQEAAYNTLKKQLADLESVIDGDGSISAPCDGIISAIGYASGDEVQANQVILTISKPSSLSMSISMSEEDVTAIHVGQQAEITLTAYEGQTFAAEVDSITTEPARSGSASVSYMVTVKMTDENTNTVYEGMSGEVTLLQKQIKDVLYVSNQAVSFEDGRSYVDKKASDGSTVKTEIKTGFSNGRYVEIISGLSEGDRLSTPSAISAN